jgi:hypothetical protein
VLYQHPVFSAAEGRGVEPEECPHSPESSALSIGDPPNGLSHAKLDVTIEDDRVVGDACAEALDHRAEAEAIQLDLRDGVELTDRGR